MTFGLTLVTPPASEPITVEQVKGFLRVDQAVDDALLQSLIAAARSHVERITNRALLTQTWDMTLDRFPYAILPIPARGPDGSAIWPGGTAGMQAIKLPRAPVQSVTSVNYIDTTGTPQLLAGASYTLDTSRSPARLVPAYGLYWPSTQDAVNAVTVRFVAGWTAGNVPDPVLHAMRFLISHFYDNRALVGNTQVEIPYAVEALLADFRLGWFA